MCFALISTSRTSILFFEIVHLRKIKKCNVVEDRLVVWLLEFCNVFVCFHRLDLWLLPPTAGVTMASLSLNRAAVVAKCTLVQQGSHFLGANKKMHQLAVKTLPPIIHVKQHMVRCQSMAGASMPQSSPDESFPTATGRLETCLDLFCRSVMVQCKESL